MANQSFRQVFVTNSPALLADGSTVDNLAVGQVGILDAKTYLAVGVPTYAKNKAVQFVWGTPDTSGLPMMAAGNGNQNEYSKLIKGKSITNFRAKKAKRGQNQAIVVGFSGDVSDTNTLFAYPGEIRKFYLKLTGGPIDKLFSKQGVTREYVYEAKIASDCTDTCATVDSRDIANSIANQINSDLQINKLVKATTIISCTPALAAPSTVNEYNFQLRVCDTRDDAALGIVQAQYPTLVITRVGTEGATSVYQAQKSANSLPSAFSNAGVVLAPDCDICPSGYTKYPSGFVYTVVRQDSGTAGNLTTLISDYAVASTGESGVRIAYEYGQSTYVIVSTTAVSSPAVTGDVVMFKGLARETCVITSPSTIAWTYFSTQVQYPQTYTLTIADSICGTNRLADIQAALPALTVTIVNASGSCVHTYQTTVYSQSVDVACSTDLLQFIKPQSFEGVDWVATPVAALAAGTVCLAGIRLDVAFVNRVTTECTFDYFPYEMETVHLQASSFNPDYNGTTTSSDWVVKQIQAAQFPAGFGAHVRLLEKESLSYNLKERSFDPVVRDAESYRFQALANTYYDEYVLEFNFAYKVGGWGQSETDAYSLHLYFPEGQGKNFEASINSYLASANINVDPVVL